MPILELLPSAVQGTVRVPELTYDRTPLQSYIVTQIELSISLELKTHEPPVVLQLVPAEH